MVIAATSTGVCAQDAPARSVTAQEQVTPTAGLVVTSDITFAPGTYFLPADSTGAVVVRGDNIRVVMEGVTLLGTQEPTNPERFTGTGIRVEESTGVEIRGGSVRGYKVGVHATDVDSLRVIGGDFSYNYRQRLKSTIEREHLDDWMSYHQNEADEWLRYGAAVYIRDSKGPIVQGVTVTGGQNGIMLTSVSGALISDNDITFNSAIGIGLYRSSGNHIRNNRLDWNVRGYSHGFYNRGQDSAALLLYEQSSSNTISHNSATHSGDGLFLWAGQTTMDTGVGGCNDNLITGNDFSYAPTNGIEVTFSRNTIVGNRIAGCWHGIWGGYSYDTVIAYNQFVDNDEHIAIEHGQDITVRANTFSGGGQGVRAWERASQPDDWGYARERDVRSRDYSIRDNVFTSVGKPFNLTSTENVVTDRNEIVAGWSHRVDPTDHVDPSSSYYAPPDPRVDRSYILVNEWGPVDFRSPVLWPRSDRRAAVQKFETVGPPGTWEIVRTKGVASVSLSRGRIGDRIEVTLDSAPVVDVEIEMQFVGEGVTDQFGQYVEAGVPFGFGYRYSFVPVNWTVGFFEYSEQQEPRSNYDAFRKLIEGPPLVREEVEQLAYQAFRSPAPGVRADHFATVAEADIDVPAGRYVLDLTSDDGVRVWVDGVVVHDDWTYHAPRLAQVELDLAGQHSLRIEHFEISGYATLVASLSLSDRVEE